MGNCVWEGACWAPLFVLLLCCFLLSHSVSGEVNIQTAFGSKIWKQWRCDVTVCMVALIGALDMPVFAATAVMGSVACSPGG
jgi:hypothetical protein